MATLFAYAEHEYTHRGTKYELKKGESVVVDDALANRLTAAHPDKLVILLEGENPPNVPKAEGYPTSVIVRPLYDRSMIPGGRLSQQKKKLLQNARKRSRHARLTITQP